MASSAVRQVDELPARNRFGAGRDGIRGRRRAAICRLDHGARANPQPGDDGHDDEGEPGTGHPSWSTTPRGATRALGEGYQRQSKEGETQQQPAPQAVWQEPQDAEHRRHADTGVGRRDELSRDRILNCQRERSGFEPARTLHEDADRPRSES